MRTGLLLLALLFVGCGGRSAIGSRPAGATPADGSPTPRLDGPPWTSGRERGLYPGREASVPDVHVPPPPDKGCLPVPASQVQGTYLGKWKGSASCFGPSSFAGDVKFQLTSTGGSSFSVSGGLSGSMITLPISSPISGGMSCTSLNGTLTSVVIGSGAIVFQGTGMFTAQYAMDAAGAWGFPAGSWTFQQSGGPCTGSGTWSASKQ